MIQKGLIIALFFYLLSCSCSVQKKIKSTPDYDLKLELNAAFDSLKTNFDYVVVYSNACIGCMPGHYQYAYIFWGNKDAQEVKVKKLDIYKEYPNVKSGNSIFKYLRNKELALREKIDVQNSKPELLHYNYTEIKFSTINGTKSYTYYENNQKGEKVIDQFRLLILIELLQIESNPFIW